MKLINHIGLSGGKDSTALWGWVINDSGYPPESIRGSFADTQNEFPEVYEQIKALDEYGQKRGIAPVRTLNSIGFIALAIKKKKFPSAVSRFCTESLKIFPAQKYFQELWLDGYDIISHVGVRRDESIERSMLDEWDLDRGGLYRIRRPILDWSISDVWDAHRKYGLPINRLYRQGFRRVGCRLCIMSGKADIRRVAKKKPEVIDEIREWERLVGQVLKDTQIASFFPVNTTPDAQNSRTYTRKDGEVFSVAMIDDVVRWSRTLRGGTQNGFDFMFDEDDAASPCAAGYCE